MGVPITKYNLDLMSTEIMVPHQPRNPNKPHTLLKKKSTS